MQLFGKYETTTSESICVALLQAFLGLDNAEVRLCLYQVCGWTNPGFLALFPKATVSLPSHSSLCHSGPLPLLNHQVRYSDSVIQ